MMKPENDPEWTAEKFLELGRSYQSAAVFLAAAELGVFDPLLSGPRSAAVLAQEVAGSLRGMTRLLDALVSLKILEKQGDLYFLVAGVGSCLSEQGQRSVLAMARHQANCLRKWAQLARVVKTGQPAAYLASIRGEQGDQEAFIGAMDNIGLPIADSIVQTIQPGQFKHLLDLGGASGTWTVAFLRACPTAQATLFDLPEVIPLAERRLKSTGLMHRIQLCGGDFMVDPLPGGMDLAWISAIVHQNSPAQNRRLFANVHRALVPEGRLVIRDVLMDDSHTSPAIGALFAINMLVATEGGDTYSFMELKEMLSWAGFADVRMVRQDPGMNSLVIARKPAPVNNPVNNP